MDNNIILGKSILTNTSDAYVGTLNVSYSQYTNNGVYLCQVDITNTTISPTLSLNGLTNYPIKRNDGTSVSIGELQANAWYLFMFDEITSVFEILNLSIPYFNGTTNYVAKYTPTGNVLGISQIFDNGTNVGIGTITPTSKLQIKGNGIDSTTFPLLIQNGGDIEIFKIYDSGLTKFTRPSDPSYNFIVSLGDFEGTVLNTTGGYQGYMINNIPSGYYMRLEHGRLSNSGSSGWINQMNMTDNGFSWSINGNGTYQWSINTTTLMRILNNGNVGIGTSTPTSKLHIKGIDSTSSNYSLKIDNSASSPLLYVRNDGVILANNLPTSSAGLPSGAIWNNSGVLNIV